MRRIQQGFTLVEVLVALAMVALMGSMSWIGMDVLLRSQEAVERKSVESASLQIALEQWSQDLNQAWMPDGTEPMGWDGKVFRLTRRAQEAAQGVVVVAWTVRESEHGLQWMRWQSAPGHTVAHWQSAWQAASHWARGGALAQSVTLWPATGMQMYVWSSNAWVSAQSTQEADPAAQSSGAGLASKGRGQAQQPKGLRLVVDTPQGTLTKDWVTPLWSERKS